MGFILTVHSSIFVRVPNLMSRKTCSSTVWVVSVMLVCGCILFDDLVFADGNRVEEKMVQQISPTFKLEIAASQKSTQPQVTVTIANVSGRLAYILNRLHNPYFLEISDTETEATLQIDPDTRPKFSLPAANMQDFEFLAAKEKKVILSSRFEKVDHFYRIEAWGRSYSRLPKGRYRVRVTWNPIFILTDSRSDVSIGHQQSGDVIASNSIDIVLD